MTESKAHDSTPDPALITPDLKDYQARDGVFADGLYVERVVTGMPSGLPARFISRDGKYSEHWASGPSAGRSSCLKEAALRRPPRPSRSPN